MSTKFCDISGLSLIAILFCVSLQDLTIFVVWVASQHCVFYIDTWVSGIACLFLSIYRNICEAICWCFENTNSHRKNFQMHFWKQSFDQLWIPLRKKINIAFFWHQRFATWMYQKCIECILSHFPLVRLLILFLLHFSFFWSNRSHDFKMEWTAPHPSHYQHDTKSVKMANNDHHPITSFNGTPGHRQLPQRGSVDCTTNSLISSKTISKLDNTMDSKKSQHQ